MGASYSITYYALGQFLVGHYRTQEPTVLEITPDGSLCLKRRDEHNPDCDDDKITLPAGIEFVIRSVWKNKGYDHRHESLAYFAKFTSNQQISGLISCSAEAKRRFHKYVHGKSLCLADYDFEFMGCSFQTGWPHQRLPVLGTPNGGFDRCRLLRIRG